MDVAGWVTLPFGGERLESAVHLGNGKDAEFRLTFAGGRRMVLSVSAVRVEADRGIIIDVTSWGDLSIRIEYLGHELRLRGGRIRFPDDDDESGAEFLAEVESWLATGRVEELAWVVEVELSLASGAAEAGNLIQNRRGQDT